MGFLSTSVSGRSRPYAPILPVGEAQNRNLRVLISPG